MSLSRPFAALAACLCASVASAQTAVTKTAAVTPTSNTSVTNDGPATEPRVTARTADAVRADRAPVIDGRDDDAVWSRTPKITQFREFQPRIDGDPRFATEAKFAYDERYVYAFVRAFDPRPDSIVSLLSRRDVRTNSEQIKIVIDSHHDKRSALQFAVNPAGVKRDYTIVNDVEEDGSWDGVWDVATTIDSLGWTAEYRIPLSQLRFARKDVHTFGVGFWRDVARTGERYSWPLYDRSKFGVVSQLGEIHGITGLGSPRRLELLPYTVTKSATRASAYDDNGIESRFETTQEISGGGDVKYGLTSNLTLDATINPDFGQVDADPAQVSLNGAALFLTEQRPFFIEGAGMMSFRMGGNNSGLFYSRRIGRAPSLTDWYGSDGAPVATTILGAAKVTGRLQSGLSVGVLDAVTQKEFRSRSADFEGRPTVEPMTNFFVTRLSQDLRGGKTGVGLMLTAVNRRNDDWADPYLHNAAYTNGLDFRHRFGSGNVELSGYVAGSHVRGSPEAIALTQTSFVHRYQRPDDDLDYDPTRTTLTGNAAQIVLGKFGGGMTRFETFYRRISPGFDVNDAGFLQRADEQMQGNWFGLQFQKPTRFYRMGGLNFNQFTSWNTEGLRLNMGGNINGWLNFPNQWEANAGIEAFALPGSYNDRSSQGGRAVRRSQWYSSWAGLFGDPRMVVQPRADGFIAWGDEGRSTHFEFGPGVNLRAGGRFSMELSPRYFRMDDHSQEYFFGLPEQFATIDYRQLSLRTRMNFTATPTLTFQMYAEPFISSYDFSDLRHIGDPDAKRLDDRYVPVTDSMPFDYQSKQLRMNSVVRWEYRPGSSIFFVWSQDRDESYGTTDGMATNGGMASPGSFRPGRDYRNLFSRHPKNTFMIKASYWLSL